MRIIYLECYGLQRGFQKLGHEVRIVRMFDLARCFAEFHPDLIVSSGYNSDYLKPQNGLLINKLCRESGCLHVYWATEDIIYHKLWSLPRVKAARPNAVFTINADCIPFYEKLGIPAYHLEFGFGPEFEPTAAESNDPRYQHDVALVATAYYNVWRHPNCFRYKSLEILLQPLAERGYDVILCGNGWNLVPEPAKKLIHDANILGPVSYQDTYRVYKSAKIILNPQNQVNHTTQVTQRTFEISGCGGFQLTSRTMAVEKLFTHRNHLLMSSSPEETLELVDYYLDNDQERQIIAAKGQAEVLAKHTYEKRAEYLLSCLGYKSDIKSNLNDVSFIPG